ncbi:Protein of unknown function [Gryllus bimaculatus]|nr:Protein of unknown function [Gryllus bimaculatus]
MQRLLQERAPRQAPAVWFVDGRLHIRNQDIKKQKGAKTGNYTTICFSKPRNDWTNSGHVFYI